MGFYTELSKVFKEYMLNSSLHGARFLVSDDYTAMEKLFWLICVSVAWITSWFLIRASLESFQNNAISFVVESSYRDWNTNFPTVIACETKNPAKVQVVADKLWGADHDFTLEEALHEIAYFRGESYYSIEECAKENPSSNCILSNFSYYSGLVRSSCEETLRICQWNDLQFNCCDYFMPLKTELGICYAMNSIQSENPNKVKLEMVMNKYTGPGRLRLEILTEANIYILGEEDVPHLLTPKADILAVSPYISYKRQIAIRNIENDPQTRSVSVKLRSCRYSEENYLHVHQYYSYSACSVECRMRQQLRVCNCTNHFIPNILPEKHCDIQGLKCLSDNYEELTVVIPHWSHGRKGVVCQDCLPSCTELDVSVVHDSVEKTKSTSDTPVAEVKISPISLPTERYKRNVVRGRLDLVVSIGGSTGLFVGASLLSFIELIYYFTIRPYVNYRKQKQQQQRDQQQQQQQKTAARQQIEKVPTVNGSSEGREVGVGVGVVGPVASLMWLD